MQLSIKRVECKIDCELRIVVLSFSHLACFLINIFGKLPFSPKSDRKKKKSVLSFTHEQTIIHVGSYLQVKWLVLGQRKGRKICIE